MVRLRVELEGKRKRRSDLDLVWFLEVMIGFLCNEMINNWFELWFDFVNMGDWFLWVLSYFG